MVTADGSADLRNYIQNNWTTVTLLDDTGSIVTSVNISNDSRFQFSSGSGANPLTIEATVSGSDSDIPLPVTLSSVELSSSDVIGAVSKSFSNAKLERSGDDLNLTIDINIG